MGLVQQWATALASRDWPTVRALDPAMASMSDDQLQSGYGGLNGATIVYVSGDPQAMRVASVAQEDVGQGPRTNVYCYDVTVDETSSTLRETRIGVATPTALPGYQQAADLAPQIASCAQ